MFNKFQCRNLREYDDLYITTDVLILADVFEAFRDTCINHCGLDPMHLYTSPELAWKSSLKITDIELELLTDNDMHLFIEKGLRDGAATITHNYAHANNPLLDNYDPSEENEYIISADANKLYGWEMSQPLPVRKFKWADIPEDIDPMSRIYSRIYSRI